MVMMMMMLSRMNRKMHPKPLTQTRSDPSISIYKLLHINSAAVHNICTSFIHHIVQICHKFYWMRVHPDFISLCIPICILLFLIKLILYSHLFQHFMIYLSLISVSTFSYLSVFTFDHQVMIELAFRLAFGVHL